MFKFLIINGPNLNMLGAREEEHYGDKTLDQIKKNTERKIKDSGLKVELTWMQSNIEESWSLAYRTPEASLMES